MGVVETVSILAGGASRRMGRDKAVLPVGGVPLLERTARLAGDAARTVLVVGRSRPPEWRLPGTRFVEDRVSGLGPLGGLVTALAEMGDSLLLTACDMPALSKKAFLWLLDAASARTLPDGLIVRNGDQIEPLFSVYTPACLPIAEAQIASGRRSLHALIGAGAFTVLDAPPPIAACLTNVNTPEDLAVFAGPPDRGK